MVHFDPEAQLSEVTELQGSLGQGLDKKLMHSVLENDKQTIDQGQLINEAVNRGLQAFVPDLLFAQLVKNYQLAKQLWGPTLLRLLTGFEPGYVERNLGIPEFKRKLQTAVKENIEMLRQSGLISGEGEITAKGKELAALVLLREEFESLQAKGLLGHKASKQRSHYGERSEARQFRRGDRYKDIALRQSIRAAIRHRSRTIAPHDLKTSERIAKSGLAIVYGIDASASMKGNKLEQCKKAGIALSYRALREKDLVGLVVFGSDVKDELAPSDDFAELTRKIANIRASRETNMATMMRRATELLATRREAKHLVIISDALPTWGEAPEKETLAAVSEAANAQITISVIGIQLDEKGENFAKEIVRIGNGRLLAVRELGELDKLILEDYESASAAA